ncbi:MAG: hypothetical protein H7263_08950 [Candidatus Sericytochromatia bacterium]|nr:hypothetical protein [Candidatus Sericytochromatia bacterium]
MPLHLTFLYRLLNTELNFSTKELAIIDRNPIWIFNYSSSHFYLIFNRESEILDLIYPKENESQGNKLNFHFVDKLVDLYIQIILIYSFRYIIYHPQNAEAIEKYIINYYYTVYENRIEFRKKFGINNFKDFLHLKE